jgi:BirA family transcriptional regulator, biotin operon repressor / biotin---[acetyl-CoA-carboxylase] ligase
LNKIQPNTLFFGKVMQYLPSCHSTNDIALQLLKEEAVIEGTLVITNHQTAGRGQRGNTWEAQEGENLTFSLILKPHWLKATEQFGLNMAVSLAVHTCVSTLVGDGVKVKWPNDIYYYDKKIGGILIENTLQGYQLGDSVVGIGLNINQQHFGVGTATSLFNILGRHVPLTPVLERLLESLEQQYLLLKNNPSALETAYLSQLYRLGEKHFFEQNGYHFLGEIVGLSPTGQLGILTQGEVRYFDFKEVSFVV